MAPFETLNLTDFNCTLQKYLWNKNSSAAALNWFGDFFFLASGLQVMQLKLQRRHTEASCAWYHTQCSHRTIYCVEDSHMLVKLREGGEGGEFWLLPGWICLKWWDWNYGWITGGKESAGQQALLHTGAIKVTHTHTLWLFIHSAANIVGFQAKKSRRSPCWLCSEYKWKD